MSFEITCKKNLVKSHVQMRLHKLSKPIIRKIRYTIEDSKECLRVSELQGGSPLSFQNIKNYPRIR